MRIGLIGAGGTGKTTTAQAVSELIGLPFMPSVSRSVFQARGLTEMSQTTMTAEEKLDLQKAIFSAYTTALGEFRKANPDGFITDRSPLDHFCYMLTRCHEAITPTDLHSIAYSVRKSMGVFDHLFYLPLPPVTLDIDDGFRHVDRAHAYMMDAMLIGFLENWGVAYTTLEWGTVGARANKIVRIGRGAWQ